MEAAAPAEEKKPFSLENPNDSPEAQRARALSRGGTWRLHRLLTELKQRWVYRLQGNLGAADTYMRYSKDYKERPSL